MRRVLLVGAALLLAVSSARAQSPVGFMVGGALSAPTGDYGDFLDNGWFVHGGLRLQPMRWPVALRFDVGYGRNGISEDAGIGLDDVNLNAITLGANLLYDIPVGPTAPVTPGLIGGLWYVGGKVGYGDDYGGPSVDNDREWDFGFSVGGTLTLGRSTSRFRPSAEVRYVTISVDDDGEDDIGNLNYFLIGLNFLIR